MWSDLPTHARADFHSIHLTQRIFDEQLDDIQRLSILSIYGKLRNLQLNAIPAWDFIDTFLTAHRGVMDFSVTDVEAFKAALKKTRTFSNPPSSIRAWDSRELCLRYSLHFRHNAKYQDKENHISTHIDPIGLYSGPGLWRKPQVIITGPLHLICRHHYKNCRPSPCDFLQLHQTAKMPSS